MKDMRFSFKKIISFQTYSCVALVILVTLISLFGIVRAKPVYDFEDYFGVQNADDRVTDAVTEPFNIGFIDVIIGIPQLVDAIHFEKGEFSEFDDYADRIKDYLDQGVAETQKLTAYMYMTYSAFDESLFVGLLMLLQLAFAVVLPLLSVACAAYVLARFFVDKDRDSFSCYKDTQRGIKPIIRAALFLPLVAILLPSISVSWIGIILLALIVAFVLFNAACVRMKDYTPAQKRYLSVIQTGSLINLAAVCVFWIGVATSGLLEKLTALCRVDTWELYDSFVMLEGELSIAFKDIFVAVLTGLFLCFAIASRRMIATSLNRAFCNTQKKRFGNVSYEAVFIRHAVWQTVGVVILTVFLVDNESLGFSGGELVGFVTAFAGALLILASEIALKSTIRLRCIDLGKSGAETVLQGDVYDRNDEEDK